MRKVSERDYAYSSQEPRGYKTVERMGYELDVVVIEREVACDCGGDGYHVVKLEPNFEEMVFDAET